MTNENVSTAQHETLLGLTGLVTAALAGYAALYLAIGGPFAPGGALWGLCVLWVTGHVAGYITAKCRLPPLLGMVLAGLLLRNTGALTAEGVPLELSGKVRWACMALILLRAGLLVKPRALRTRALMVLRLGALPCIKTATTYSAVLGLLFKMPPLLALASGFLLAPACALSMSTDLQSLQQSEEARPSMTAGMPEVLTAASGASIALSTLFASLFCLLAFPHGPPSLIWLHPLVSMLTGCSAGVAAAALCSLRLFWRTPWQQTAIALLVAQTLAFLGFRYEYFGASVLALLVMGCGLSSFWDSAHPRLLTLPEPVRAKTAEEVGRRLDVIWTLAAEPLLFSLAGTSVSFAALPHMATAKCLAAVAIGVCVKCLVSFFGLFGTSVSLKERVLITIYTLPQASVTLTMCFLPMHLAGQFVGASSDSFADYHRWADVLATTAVMGAIVVTPLASVAMQLLAPRLREALQQSAPVSQPSGLAGEEMEAAGQLPARINAAAGRRRSDNPFADVVPFGGNTSAPAGDAAPLLTRLVAGGIKIRSGGERTGSKRPSDEESQLLENSEEHQPSSSIYITAAAGAPGIEPETSAEEIRAPEYDSLSDESAHARLLGSHETQKQSWSTRIEGEDTSVRETGNPFASFLGNPFGLGRTLSKHFGSFRAASGWPSPGAFSALKEAEIELAQDQPAANNPMYDPRFQDYVVNTTEASFHANPTFGAAPQRNLAPALRASEDRSMDVDMERDAGNMEEGGALLGAPIQAAAADWTALSTLRRMSAALVSAVSANAKRGSGQLAGEYDKAPTTQEPPDRDSSVFQRPLDGQGGWLPILGFQRKRTSESFLSGSDATSTLENLAVTFTAGSKSLIGAFGGRVGASGPAGDMGHFTVDRDWETLVDRKAEARAAEEELALDIDADTGEESPSRRDSGDLNFAVTDGFELEELPGRAHQLPITGFDFLEDSKAERAASEAGTSAVLGQQEKERSSGYALFAQLSAAAASGEESASQHAPFVLGYEIPFATAIQVEPAEPAAEASAAGGFTFAQHSPSLSPADISPIFFITPSATLLCQGSSTGHVLSMSDSSSEPNQAAHPNSSSAGARSNLSLDIDSGQVEGPGAGNSHLLISPVSGWLGKEEAARQPPPEFQLPDSEEAAPSSLARAQQADYTPPLPHAEIIKANLHVRVHASKELVGDTSMESIGLEDQESFAAEQMTPSQQEKTEAAAAAVNFEREAEKEQLGSEDRGFDEEMSFSGAEASAELEGFDSIPLTPKLDGGDDSLDSQSVGPGGATSESGKILGDIISLAEEGIFLQIDNVEEDRPGARPDSAGAATSDSNAWIGQPADDSVSDVSIAWADQAADVVMSDVVSTGDRTAAGVEESTPEIEIKRAERPRSASRFREGLSSMRAVKEAGSATVGKFSSLPKSLGRLVRHSVSGGAKYGGSGMEPNVADQAQESNSATAPQTPGKGTRTSSFRNLLRPLSPRSVDSLAPSDSRAPDLYATVRPSSPPSLETEEGEKKGLCNIDHPVAESWLRKAYSITSPRPTDQDDLPVLDVPSTSDAWSKLADTSSTGQPETDAGMAVTSHFSSAKRYSDVDAKSSALLRAQASIKAYRRTDSSHKSTELRPPQSAAAAVQGSTLAVGGDESEEWDFEGEVELAPPKGPATFGKVALDFRNVRKPESAEAVGAIVLEDVSLQEEGKGGKRKRYFARKLRHDN